jgi:flagellar hook-associated protein 3 FlgL
MRITDGIMMSEALLAESRAQTKMAEVMQESATGNMISQPSDDPSGFGTLVSIDSQLSIMQGRQTAATTASSNVSLASGALSSANDLLTQAGQIALTAVNGSQDATSRSIAAAEVQSLVQQMIGIGNTQGPDGYLFGGTSTATPPFGPAGNFTGNNGITQVEVAQGVLVNSNVSGADAFTAAGGGSNVIADLQSLATALNTNNVAGIQSSIGQMASDRQQVSAVMVQAGATSDTLAASATLITSLTTAAETSRAAIDNAATPTVYSELASTQTAYQASLSVTQQILSLQSFSSQG